MSQVKTVVALLKSKPAFHISYHYLIDTDFKLSNLVMTSMYSNDQKAV